MKVEIEILTLAEQEPEQDERVMVYNERFREWCPQCFNKYYECWDDASGDDYERDYTSEDRWFRLPK